MHKVRLTHFCGDPEHGDELFRCSKATGLTYSSEQCRRNRLEKHSTYSKTVCLASTRAEKHERSTHSPLSVPKNDSVINGQVDVVEYLGDQLQVYLTAEGARMVARLNPRSRVSVGGPVRLHIENEQMHLFDTDTGRAIF